MHGKLVYQRAHGFADRESGRRVTSDTVFRWASLTKPLTSVATLALVERGVLNLDDPVTKFIPDFRPKLASGEEPAIAVRHLLTHTSGLTYALFRRAGNPYEKAGVSDGLDAPGLSIEENLRRVARAPLLFAPGSGWQYSIAIDVLGEVIARASGASLPALIAELITAPLGMTQTSFTPPERERLATAYAPAKPVPDPMKAHHLLTVGEDTLSFAPDRNFDPASYPSGGAGLFGTAHDFLRFLEALRTGDTALVSPASLALLSKNATRDLPTLVPGWGFGLGWSILYDPALAKSPQSPESWFWGGVYGNSWFVDPPRGLTVVILTNTALTGMLGRFPDAVRDALYAGAETCCR